MTGMYHDKRKRRGISTERIIFERDAKKFLCLSFRVQVSFFVCLFVFFRAFTIDLTYT